MANAITKANAIVRNAKGQPFSKWKPADKFHHVLLLEGIEGIAEGMLLEHVFNRDRGFRMDFAWPLAWVAVEIDGFGFGHQAQQCMAADNDKANLAIEMGWRVLRYNSRQLGSRKGVSDAVEQTCRVLCDVEIGGKPVTYIDDYDRRQSP